MQWVWAIHWGMETNKYSTPQREVALVPTAINFQGVGALGAIPRYGIFNWFGLLQILCR